MFLVLFLGAPGSGKGSLAQILVEKYNFIHFSTGKIFRSQKNKTLSTGKLVLDDQVNALVLEEFKKLERENGPNARVVLDGYPRTQVQAEFLRKHYPINKVFLLANISPEFLMERLDHRLICEANDHSFNLISRPPKVSGICDFDGSKLYRRDDDSGEIVKKRLQVYEELTQPLIEYYRKTGNLIEIDAARNLADVASDLLKLLKDLNIDQIS